MEKDLYAILGLNYNAIKNLPSGNVQDKNTIENAIRSAFRKMSKEYHPDLNPGDEKAPAKIIEINNAYEVLINPTKRAKYNSQYRPQPSASPPPQSASHSARSSTPPPPPRPDPHPELKDMQKQKDLEDMINWIQPGPNWSYVYSASFSQHTLRVHESQLKTFGENDKTFMKKLLDKGIVSEVVNKGGESHVMIREDQIPKIRNICSTQHNYTTPKARQIRREFGVRTHKFDGLECALVERQNGEVEILDKQEYRTSYLGHANEFKRNPQEIDKDLDRLEQVLHGMGYQCSIKDSILPNGIFSRPVLHMPAGLTFEQVGPIVAAAIKQAEEIKKKAASEKNNDTSFLRTDGAIDLSTLKIKDASFIEINRIRDGLKSTLTAHSANGKRDMSMQDGIIRGGTVEVNGVEQGKDQGRGIDLSKNPHTRSFVR